MPFFREPVTRSRSKREPFESARDAALSSTGFSLCSAVGLQIKPHRLKPVLVDRAGKKGMMMAQSEEGKREFIARRVARELRDGYYVNLGIGTPTLVANYIPAGMEVVMHSENGMLGVGPFPFEGEEDADLINAGKETVTEIPGTSYFSSAESFAMIRGGHIDFSVLGAMEVVAGARRTVIAMEHTTREGEPKILKKCTLPLTGLKVVNTIVTEMAYISVTPEGLVLEELAKGLTAEDVQKATEARLIVSPNLKIMEC